MTSSSHYYPLENETFLVQHLQYNRCARAARRPRVVGRVYERAGLLTRSEYSFREPCKTGCPKTSWGQAPDGSNELKEFLRQVERKLLEEHFKINNEKPMTNKSFDIRQLTNDHIEDTQTRHSQLKAIMSRQVHHSSYRVVVKGQ